MRAAVWLIDGEGLSYDEGRRRARRPRGDHRLEGQSGAGAQLRRALSPNTGSGRAMTDQTPGLEARDRELRDRLRGARTARGRSRVLGRRRRPDRYRHRGRRAVETPEHLDGFWASIDGGPARRARPPRSRQDRRSRRIADNRIPGRGAGSETGATTPHPPTPGVDAGSNTLATNIRGRCGRGLAGRSPGVVGQPAVKRFGSLATKSERRPSGRPRLPWVRRRAALPSAPLFNDKSRVEAVQPAGAAGGSVPVGASPDGKFLYVAASRAVE